MDSRGAQPVVASQLSYHSVESLGQPANHFLLTVGKEEEDS